MISAQSSNASTVRFTSPHVFALNTLQRPRMQVRQTKTSVRDAMRLVHSLTGRGHQTDYGDQYMGEVRLNGEDDPPISVPFASVYN